MDRCACLRGARLPDTSGSVVPKDGARLPDTSGSVVPGNKSIFWGFIMGHMSTAITLMASKGAAKASVFCSLYEKDAFEVVKACNWQNFNDARDALPLLKNKSGISGSQFIGLANALAHGRNVLEENLPDGKGWNGGRFGSFAKATRESTEPYLLALALSLKAFSDKLSECPDWRDKTVEEIEKQKAENKAKKAKSEKEKAEVMAQNARAAIEAAIACGEVVRADGTLTMGKATPGDLIRAIGDSLDNGIDGFPFEAFMSLALRVETKRAEMENRAKAIQEAKAKDAERQNAYTEFRASLESKPMAFEVEEKQNLANEKKRKNAEKDAARVEMTAAQNANHAQHVAEYHTAIKKQKAAKARALRATKAAKAVTA